MNRVKVIKGVLVKVDESEQAKETTFEKHDFTYRDFHDFYRLLDIETFDIVSRKIGGKYFDIYCDDEGLFKENKVPALISIRKGKIEEAIFGNIFICKNDGEGESIGMSEEEQNLILKNTVTVLLGTEFRQVLRAEL